MFHLGKHNLLPMFKIMSDEEEYRRTTVVTQPKKYGGKVGQSAAAASLISPSNSIDNKNGPSNVARNEVLMTLIHEMANRLFTVCAIHSEYPFIQYQGSSEFSRLLAQTLHELFEEFYAKDMKSVKEPRGSILILDRSFDLIAPVQHDFFYQTNVNDLKEGFGLDKKEIKLDGKPVSLTDQDEMWVKLKNMHALDAFIYVR